MNKSWKLLETGEEAFMMRLWLPGEMFSQAQFGRAFDC